eukprot:TRINITY_DN3160_c2_g1_i14.p1 TRINITY_DN3160_c2_g1~~TRINITY_DN3160_c2_g1_i14.p1  ORF type:complete len:957 (-),score=317.14 TRINITY_DN3160_c2_g1_i14:853-3690(-)
MVEIEDLPLLPKVRTSATAAHQKPDVASRFKRNQQIPQNQLHSCFELDEPLYTEEEAVREALRCMKCADAPCSYGCPSNVDVKSFIQAIATGDFYSAAKTVVSDNPLGYTCGLVCPGENFCMSTCNAHSLVSGPINIPKLQAFIMNWLNNNNIPLKVPKVEYETKIGLIGSGPASLSCATYLKRLGHDKVKIYEKLNVIGGTMSNVIPPFRLPKPVVDSEIERIQKSGVQFELGIDVDLKKIEEFKNEKNLDSVFLAPGLGKPVIDENFQVDNEQIFDCKTFLSVVNEKTNCGKIDELPNFYGKRVAVLGAGDSAIDCARSAIRLGAARTELIFRRSIQDMRCSEAEKKSCMAEGVVFNPNLQPVGFENNTVKCVRFQETLNGYEEFKDQVSCIPADIVIVAFGFTGTKYKPEWLTQKLDKYDWLFVGGDAACIGNTVVEAIGSGKRAALAIHKQLTGETVALPEVESGVEDVDISFEICGVKFPNPFGLASAPPTTCASMIDRAFEEGWGFAVIKTVVFEEEDKMLVNVSPRIARQGVSLVHGSNQQGFLNIELLTEKRPIYWKRAINSLKEKHPDKVIVCSIMCTHDKEEWKKAIEFFNDSKADIYELNLSCPHSGDRGYGIACGQDADTVYEITSWVKEFATKPVFVKLTPNITDIVFIADAAIAGGCDGLTAINTVSGIVTIDKDGAPWPAVGSEKLGAYGGVSGNLIRHMGLRAISAIRKKYPDIPLLATGGCDGGLSAMQYIHAGAHGIQVASAIMNQDYSIVRDMKLGIQHSIYERNQTRTESKKIRSTLSPEDYHPAMGEHQYGSHMVVEVKTREIEAPKEPVTMENVRSLTVKKHLQPGVEQLSRTQQVIARISYDDCLNCGKCFMSCADTGYQAIEFGSDHIPIITDRCMGCGLCCSVCPSQAIAMEFKGVVHKVNRGGNDDDYTYIEQDCVNDW